MKTVALPIRRLGLLSIAILCLAAGCRVQDDNRPPVIGYTPLPEQMPVPLQVGSVDKFVDWISTMPSSQLPLVKAQIASAASNPAVVEAVGSRLSFAAPGSYGRQLIYPAS
jgi:hypothetical protein